MAKREEGKSSPKPKVSIVLLDFTDYLHVVLMTFGLLEITG